MGKGDLRSIGDYFAMGGHGAFIWPSFAVAALVMVALLIVSLRSLHARQSDLKAIQEARRGGVTGSGATGDEA